MSVYKNRFLKISIDDKTIKFEGKSLFGKLKAASFNLSEVTRVSLFYIPPTGNGVDASFDSEKIPNILLNEYKPRYDLHAHAGGGTVIAQFPFPVAVFFIQDRPVFYINFTVGPGKEKPLHDIIQIIGKDKFDESLFDVFTEDYRKASDVYIKHFKAIYLVAAASLIISMFVSMVLPSLVFSILNNNPNAHYIFNPFMVLVILSSLVAPVFLFEVIERKILSNRIREFIERRPEFFRGATKLQNRLFNKIKLPALLLYVVTLLVSSTSNYVVTSESIAYELLFMKTGEVSFNQLNGVELDCGVKKESDKPSYTLNLKNPGKLDLGISCKGLMQDKLCLSDEQIKNILSKIPVGYSITSKNCPSFLDEEVLNKFCSWGLNVSKEHA